MKWLAHRLFWASQAPGWARFRRMLKRPRETQQGLLMGMLRSQAGCEWGRRYDLASIRSTGAFQARLPLCNYADLEPAIIRMRGGEKDILFPGQARLFEPSGGSSAGPGLIPYNAALQAQFQAGLAPWIYDLYARYPELRGGSAYWSVTPQGALKKEAIGFESDAAYFGSLGEKLAGLFLAAPASLAGIDDLAEFRRQSLACLAKARSLRFISVWNPSFLTLLLEGVKDPARLWPELRLISCWGDAHAAAALPALQTMFPGVEIQPKGLLATEAMVSLPFEGEHPLSLGSHFFEFLDSSGRAGCAWDLKKGGEYSMVVTTAGGLYRYRLHDRVQVTAFLGDTPCLRFLGKEDCVSDLCGEKLEEAFVAAALQRLYAARGLRPAFSIMAPEKAGYVLYFEGQAPPSLEGDLESELCANFHYDYCRRLGQLKSVRLQPLPEGSAARYLSGRARAGRQLGSIKALALDPLPWTFA